MTGVLATIGGKVADKTLDSVIDEGWKRIQILFNPHLKLLGIDSVRENFKIFYGRLELAVRLGANNEPKPTRDVRYDSVEGTAVFSGVIPPFGDINFPPSGIPLPYETMPIQLRVLTAYKTDTGKIINGPKRLMGENEAFVASYVWSSLLGAGYKKEIALFPGKSVLDEGSNFSFFSIGGPAANAVSNQLLNMFGTTVKFLEDGTAIVADSGTRFSIDGVNDYAVLAKVDNKMNNNPDKRFKGFIAAGLGEVGTQGAGRFFYTNAKLLASKFRNDNFEVILRVSGKSLSDTTIVYEKKL